MKDFSKRQKRNSSVLRGSQMVPSFAPDIFHSYRQEESELGRFWKIFKEEFRNRNK